MGLIRRAEAYLALSWALYLNCLNLAPLSQLMQVLPASARPCGSYPNNFKDYKPHSTPKFKKRASSIYFNFEKCALRVSHSPTSTPFGDMPLHPFATQLQ